MSEQAHSASASSQLYENAVAALREEQLDRVGLGGGVITWIESGSAQVGNEVVIRYTPDENGENIMAITYALDGTVVFLIDYTIEQKVVGIGGAETSAYADVLAGTILPRLLHDYFM